MNKEWAIIIVPAVSWILFAMGGIGPKWVRRYILPIFLGISVYYVAQVSLLSAVLGSAVLSATLHLPYGDSVPLWLKFIIGCSYSASTLLWGFSMYQGLYPLIFFTLFYLSLKGKITWKLVEGFAGLGLGIIAVLV